MVGVIQDTKSPGSMTDHRAECFYGVKEGIDKIPAAKASVTAQAEGTEAAASASDSSKAAAAAEPSKKEDIKKEDKKDDKKEDKKEDKKDDKKEEKKGDSAKKELLSQ